MRLIVLCLLPFFGWSQSPLIPAPKEYEAKGDTLKLIAAELNLSGASPEACKTFLDRERTRRYGAKTGISSRIRLQHIENSFNDHYELTIDKDILISYTSDRSCFYALNTLLQLISPQADGTLEIPKCRISDHPDFEWRGLHLDVARHFFTVEEVKRYIDLMAYYKFNTFHWHLTDDQGWRIEIKKYPELTQTGGWRDSTLENHYTTSPRTYDHQRYGGFYTQEEIREVVKYAADRYITVVPEIEMPGHARAALAAYPQLGCTGDTLGVEGLWGVFDDIFCTKAVTIGFLTDVLDEVITLFPSEYIHIGGDETPKTRWKRCPECQKRILENDLKNEQELQSWFIAQMDSYLSRHGRKLIGWDEILEGGLSPNAAVMSWRGFEGGKEAAELGHAVVMTPGAYCYFDHYQSRAAGEPLAFGGFTPLSKVYAFDPVPKGLTSEEASHIIGVQANLWTEYIPDFKQVEYMVYPRALALSQVAWSGRSKPEWDEFKQILIRYHFPFLERLNVHYSRAIFQPEMVIRQAKNGIVISWKQEIPETQFFAIRSAGLNSEFEAVPPGGVHLSPDFASGPVDVIFRTAEHSDETIYRFEIHRALGTSVELLTQPHPRYANAGGLTLVDGIRGVIPWRGNEWLGFDTSAISLIVDLGESSSFSTIEVGTLQDAGSWIHQPLQMELSFSEDGEHWSEPVIRNYEQKVMLDNSRKSRFVKVRLMALSEIPEGLPGEGNTPWTFIDEILIR